MQSWLLALIQCPITHEPLRVAESALVNALRAKQLTGKLLNRQGMCVTEEFQSGLVNASNRWFYPIIDDIPSLICEESIPL